MNLLAIFEHNPGGEYIATHNLLNAAEAEGLKVTSVELAPLEKTGLISYLKWICRSVAASAKLSLRHREHSIIYTTTYTAAVGALLVRGLTHQRIVFHYHGSRIPPLAESNWPTVQKLTQWLKHHSVTKLHRFAFERVQLFLAPSSVVLQQLLTQFPSLTTHRHILPNGVNTEYFSPVSEAERDQLRKQYHIPKSSFVCLIVSRINPAKNVPKTLRFIQTLQQNSRHRVLAILAFPHHGNDRDELNEVRSVLQTTELPHMLVENSTHLQHLYQMSDCVLSHSAKEVFPLVLLEAAACGIPYFALPNGAIEYYLQQIDEHLVLADAEQAAARQVFTHTHQRKLAQKLRAFAVEHTWQASAVKLYCLLEKLT